MARGKTICEWHKKHPGGLLVAACRGGVRFMAVFVIKTADFVIMGGLFVISGRVKRERLALAGHALSAGLEHIRLDALPGGLGGGAEVVHMAVVRGVEGAAVKQDPHYFSRSA